MEVRITVKVNTEVLVIGGGAAGLRAAIEARKYGLDVVLVSESPIGFRNNTAVPWGTFAVSGIRSELDDSPEEHLKDTIAAGRSLNDRRLVVAITQGALQQVDDLLKFGVIYRQLSQAVKLDNMLTVSEMVVGLPSPELRAEEPTIAPTSLMKITSNG